MSLDGVHKTESNNDGVYLLDNVTSGHYTILVSTCSCKQDFNFFSTRGRIICSYFFGYSLPTRMMLAVGPKNTFLDALKSDKANNISIGFKYTIIQDIRIRYSLFYYACVRPIFMCV